MNEKDTLGENNEAGAADKVPGHLIYSAIRRPLNLSKHSPNDRKENLEMVEKEEIQLNGVELDGSENPKPSSPLEKNCMISQKSLHQFYLLCYLILNVASIMVTLAHIIILFISNEEALMKYMKITFDGIVVNNSVIMIVVVYESFDPNVIFTESPFFTSLCCAVSKLILAAIVFILQRDQIILLTLFSSFIILILLCAHRLIL
ncbi:hypothetical protein Ahia01_001335000 [Argonauta hians]